LGGRKASSQRFGRKPCHVCQVQFQLFSFGNSVNVYPVQFLLFSLCNSVTVCNHSFETVSPENSSINLFLLRKFFQWTTVSIRYTCRKKREKNSGYLQSIFVALQNIIQITIMYFFFQSENGGQRKKTDLPTLFWKHTENPKDYRRARHHVQQIKLY